MNKPQRGSERPALAPILTVNFIGTLGFSLVLPFLVFLVERWGGNALIYGMMGATYSAFQLLGAPLLGRWSDRFGRRRILLASQLGTFFSWLVFVVCFFLPTEPLLRIDWRWLGEISLTLPLLVMFLARALDGATGGNVSVANAYLADITDEKDRSANFGKMAVSANLGFVFGPAIAGVLGGTSWGELLPVLSALMISAAASLLIAFRLPESSPCSLARSPEHASVRKVFGQEQRDCYKLAEAPDLSAVQILRLAGIRPLMAIYILVMLAFNLFYVAFPVHAARNLEWSLAQIGVFFSVMGLAMALVQGPLLARLSRRRSESFLAAAGSVLLAISFPLFSGPGQLQIYLGVLLLAAGNGVMWPSVLSLLSKAAGQRYQGTVQGFSGSVGAGASIAGLLIGGALFGSLGTGVFVLAATLIAASWVVILTTPSAKSSPVSTS